jgi:catechol 2,3-dioxygenase-like lactoylglutathione lyase family enzyme
MSRVLGLDHIVLVCGDVETTLAWYQQHFGLADVRVDDWRAGAAPFPSLRVDDTTIIDLVPLAHDELERVARGHLDHLCFVVTDEAFAELKADPALVVVEEGQRYGAQGDGWSIYVHDPDGLTVEARTYPAP